jgi:hypothetical protein
MLLATFNRPNVTYNIRYKRLLQDEDVDADITRFLSSRKEECGTGSVASDAERFHREASVGRLSLLLL